MQVLHLPPEIEYDVHLLCSFVFEGCRFKSNFVGLLFIMNVPYVALGFVMASLLTP